MPEGSEEGKSEGAEDGGSDPVGADDGELEKMDGAPDGELERIDGFGLVVGARTNSANAMVTCVKGESSTPWTTFSM